MNIHNELYRKYQNKVIGISELLKALEQGFITAESFEAITQDVPDYTLEEAAYFKRKELSYLCSKNITQGVDVELSDGNTHHFSLSDSDQRNLTTKMLNIAMGMTELEYHSDGDPCRYYSTEDMACICMMAQNKVTVETTYYNCLCQWIKGCTTPQDIMAIQYGVEIPEAYWSEPWRNIVMQSTQNPGVEISDESVENTVTENEQPVKEDSTGSEEKTEEDK